MSSDDAALLSLADSLLSLSSCSLVGESELADQKHYISGEYLEHCGNLTFVLLLNLSFMEVFFSWIVKHSH